MVRVMTGLLPVALLACGETSRTKLAWPEEIGAYGIRILLGDESTLEIPIAQPSLDEPLILSGGIEPTADDALWLLLYDRPASAFRIEPGPLRDLGAERACELATPTRVFRADLDPMNVDFVESSIAEVPSELVSRHLAPADGRCVYVDCRLDARWLASAPRDRLVRVFEHPDGRGVLVDRSHGLDAVDLSTGALESLALQPGLPLMDARLHGDELFVLSENGQVWRGPITGPFSPMGSPLPFALTAANAGGLAVGGDGPEIYAATVIQDGEILTLEVFEHRATGHQRLHQEIVRSRANFFDKLSLEWLGPGMVVGVYGGERILRSELGEILAGSAVPMKVLVGGIPLDFLTILQRENTGLMVTGHEGSLWSAPGPLGPWTEVRGTVASGVGIGVVGLAELGDGVVLGDLNSGAAFVHDAGGPCFDGVMSQVYVTALGRVGERILAGGFGQLGIVERTWSSVSD